MVVTRKTPVAPVPTGSRHNSSQAVPRSTKPKTSSSLAESSPLKEAQTPAATQNPSRGFLDLMLFLFLGLFAYYTFTTCPGDHTLSNPYRTHVLEPYVIAPIENALSHPSVAPYVNKAAHIERVAIRPVVIKTVQVSAPYAAATKRVVWDTGVVPAFNAYVVPRWRVHVLPLWHKHASPHIARAAPHAARAQRALETTAAAAHKLYFQRVQPAVVQTYAFVKPFVIRTYVIAKPHVVATYVVLADRAGAARRAYVDPHVVRIWEKVLELSGAGPIGTPVSPAPPVMNKAEPTPKQSTTEKAQDSINKAEPTPKQSATEKAQDSIAKTPENTSTKAAVAPEEEVSSTTPESTSASSVAPPPAETTPSAGGASASASSSVEPETVAAAAVEPETAATPESAASAASVAMQSAHAGESVVEQIIADITPSTEAAASATEVTAAEVETSIEPELSAASMAMQSAHGMESPVVEQIIEDVKAAEASLEPTPTNSADGATPIDTSVPEPEEDEDEDLFDFLDDIGLGESEPYVDDEEEDLELSEEEQLALQQQQAEEQRVAKERNTAEKRADLEARMARSSETLSAMVKEKNKELRRMLVQTRKTAVAQMDDADTEIGGLLPGLEKDADKLLKGLEGYLKKELKGTKGGDPVERTERWNTVVVKLEEKLTEKIQAARAFMQEYHADEKNYEVEEGMAIIKQVKDACSQAQGDVGLDLSWLSDVTYADWQVYHDLARIGEKFQAEASEIQGGTHKHPPVDPFLARLKQMETEFTEGVNVFIGRLNDLKQQARTAFANTAEVPPAAEPAPEVSILPVEDSPAPGMEDFDPGQVVIGKTAEQVAEALRNVEPVHEEL
ncbi:hypothetical protein GGX14DRAFT_410949 [Mycena pura]|uniref:Uncharacterized protein n=1 Tax=Mycena pura TaxID=153505 RepID=A0AAD7E5Y6_9AGAR|nr:hypothetical protein GGX14DRAFT_410949 [Mycena pura]